jgi:hypothetical protein
MAQQQLFTNFKRGQVDEREVLRSQQQDYWAGLSELTNMVVLPNGGLKRTPGTKFVKEVNGSAVSRIHAVTAESRITSSSDRNYMLIIQDGRLEEADADDGTTIETSTKYSIDISSDFWGVSFTNELYTKDRRSYYDTGKLFGDRVFLSEGTGVYTVQFDDGTLNNMLSVFAFDTIDDSITDWTASQEYDIGVIVIHNTNEYYVCRKKHFDVEPGTDASTWVKVSKSALGNANSATDLAWWQGRLVIIEDEFVRFSHLNDPRNFYSEGTDGTSLVDDDDPINANPSLERHVGKDSSWIFPSDDALVMGTVKGEYRIVSSGPTVTPSDIAFRRVTEFGSTPKVSSSLVCRPGSAIVFASGTQTKLLEYFFWNELQAYQSRDMTKAHQSVFDGKLAHLKVQRSPFVIIWALSENGTLYSITYDENQKLHGFGKHDVGGTVEDVTILRDAGNDRVFLLVNRTIGGNTKRYIEELDSFDFGGNIEDAYYVASGKTETGSDITSVSGLDHLEGEEVAILVDGKRHPNKTVSSGSVDLDFAGDKVQVGLPMTARIQTLPLPGVNKTTISNAWFSFYETAYAKIGPDLNNMSEIIFDEYPKTLGGASLHSGWYEKNMKNVHDRKGQFYIENDTPLPMELLAMVPEIAQYGGIHG